MCGSSLPGHCSAVTVIIEKWRSNGEKRSIVFGFVS